MYGPTLMDLRELNIVLISLFSHQSCVGRGILFSYFLTLSHTGTGRTCEVYMLMPKLK